MEGSKDFIEWLGADLSVKILMFLEDPSDLVRVSSVSSSWRQFIWALLDYARMKRNSTLK